MVPAEADIWSQSLCMFVVLRAAPIDEGHCQAAFFGLDSLY